MIVELTFSTAALAFTAYQAYLLREQAKLSRNQTELSREHNRLSVMPHLQFQRAKEWSDRGLIYRYVVQNHGFGPARIKKIELFLDYELFEPKTADPIPEILMKSLTSLVPQVPLEIKSWSFPGTGYAIKAQDIYTLAVVDFPGMDMIKFQQIKPKQRADIRIVYESFYGDEGVLDTRPEDKIDTRCGAKP